MVDSDYPLWRAIEFLDTDLVNLAAIFYFPWHWWTWTYFIIWMYIRRYSFRRVGKLLVSVKALLLINWKLSHTEFISCTHSHLFIFFSVIDWSWIVKVEDQTERKNITVNNNIRWHRMPAMLIHASLLQLKLRKTWK
jgi:hypothetical protein